LYAAQRGAPPSFEGQVNPRGRAHENEPTKTMEQSNTQDEGPSVAELLEWLLGGDAAPRISALSNTDPRRLEVLAAPIRALIEAARHERFDEPPAHLVARAKAVPRAHGSLGASLAQRLLRLLPRAGAIGLAVRASGTEHPVMTLEAGGYSLDLGQSASGVVRGQLLVPEGTPPIGGCRCTIHGSGGHGSAGAVEVELEADGSFRFEHVPSAPQSLSIELADRMLVVSDLSLAAR